MSKELVHVPKITKMAKYLMALTANKDKLKGTHKSILAVLREMNTTVQIISGLTGISDDKVRSHINELEAMGLASVTETRKAGGGPPKKIWGMHDEFRSVHKVPTYPSQHQDVAMATARKKGGRSLEIDEVASILWGNPEAALRGRSGTLVEIAGTLKKTPILAREAGDAEARRNSAVAIPEDNKWDLADFVGDDEEE